MGFVGFRMAVTCRCYGEPHCQTFDGLHVTYQGTCLYTMVRDGCTEGYPSGQQTFEVLADFQDIKRIGVSWTTAAILRLYRADGVMIRASYI